MAFTEVTHSSNAATSGASNGKTPSYTLSQFTVQEELGSGSFGVVQKVINQETGEACAMKVLEKAQVLQLSMQAQLKREVLTQLRVKHRNLVRLHYYFEDASRIYCLLEFADRGHLFSYLKEHGSLPEPRAASFFRDTACGLDYLHGLSIAHRDLKPENILLFGEALLAKLGDFGWCVEVTESEPTRKTFCGTLDYVAPEMLLGEPHDKRIDLWALGVLLFEMLMARAPFTGESKKETVKNICEANFELPAGFMARGPEELVNGLLVKRQEVRLPLEQVLRHPWLRAREDLSSWSSDAERRAPELVVSNAPRPKVRSRRGYGAG